MIAANAVQQRIGPVCPVFLDASISHSAMGHVNAAASIKCLCDCAAADEELR